MASYFYSRVVKMFRNPLYIFTAIYIYICIYLCVCVCVCLCVCVRLCVSESFCGCKGAFPIRFVSYSLFLIMYFCLF
jgi:hypothetical protein